LCSEHECLRGGGTFLLVYATLLAIALSIVSVGYPNKKSRGWLAGVLKASLSNILRIELKLRHIPRAGVTFKGEEHGSREDRAGQNIVRFSTST